MTQKPGHRVKELFWTSRSGRFQLMEYPKEHASTLNTGWETIMNFKKNSDLNQKMKLRILHCFPHLHCNDTRHVLGVRYGARTFVVYLQVGGADEEAGAGVGTVVDVREDLLRGPGDDPPVAVPREALHRVRLACEGRRGVCGCIMCVR